MTSTPSSTPNRRARPRKPIMPPTDQRVMTALGTFTPMDGDFLYVHEGHVWRVLRSANPLLYEIRDAATDVLSTTVTVDIVKGILAKQWDVYQRVIT